MTGLKARSPRQPVEDKKAFEKRASELAVGLVDDVQKLAANVVAREEEGQDASGDRERVAEMLQRVSRSARDAIGRLEAEMGELREQHEAAAPEDAVEIEDQFVAVDAQLNRSPRRCSSSTIEVMDTPLASTPEPPGSSSSPF